MSLVRRVDERSTPVHGQVDTAVVRLVELIADVGDQRRMT